MSAVLDSDFCEGHVLCLELARGPGFDGPVEGEAHGTLVWVLLVLGTTVAHGIAAHNSGRGVFNLPNEERTP